MKHYENEMNLYQDNELEPEKEAEMFLHLGSCDECRKTFHNYQSVKMKSQAHFKERYENIKNDSRRNINIYRITSYLSAAAAVILLFVLFTNKPAPTYVTKNEVRVDTVFVQKEDPFTQNQTVRNGSFTPGKREFVSASQQEYLRYVMSLRTEVFTKADLIQSDNGSIQ